MQKMQVEMIRRAGEKILGFIEALVLIPEALIITGFFLNPVNYSISAGDPINQPPLSVEAYLNGLPSS